jgi:hypothetical protein
MDHIGDVVLITDVALKCDRSPPRSFDRLHGISSGTGVRHIVDCNRISPGGK